MDKVEYIEYIRQLQEDYCDAVISSIERNVDPSEDPITIVAKYELDYHMDQYIVKYL